MDIHEAEDSSAKTESLDGCLKWGESILRSRKRLAGQQSLNDLRLDREARDDSFREVDADERNILASGKETGKKSMKSNVPQAHARQEISGEKHGQFHFLPSFLSFFFPFHMLTRYTICSYSVFSGQSH